jgi:hypothetical protein
MNPKTQRARAHAATALALFCTPSAQALTDTDGLWHGNFSAGGSASSGNTRASSLTVQADASKSSEVDEITLQGLYNFNGSLSLRWTHKLAPGLKQGDSLLSFGLGRKF